ncbi:T9SS type A sorting domain-containing protein [Gilvibacter sp.]|uniref:T9SS type A sorting domain-containing protein n=1 Tax=Gilvibacter sp. TaxID=2729997 RepID=UPI0025C2FEDD|nr:T9SS type A sorting domain-containing protein [Gilvibacter sp.]NQX76586.1 T9SS type A sorting domain-containing protein [Gilvibacter sp.]
MKKITLLLACLLVGGAAFAQVNVDMANAIQVQTLPFNDPDVNVPNGAQEEGQVGCNFNVPSVDYKFEVVTGGTVTVSIDTPAGLSEPVLYYATTIDETDPTGLTVTDNLGGVGAGCFDNDAGPDGVRTTVVNDGDIMFVFVANEGISGVSFSGDAVLATLSTADNNLEGVSVYPNPVKDVLNVTVPVGAEVTSAKLFDVLGRDTGVVMVNGAINTSGLSNGIYMFTLETTEGNYTTKIVKQ